MIGMDHIQNTIFFCKDVTMEDLEMSGSADCFLTKDVVFQPNSVTQVEFDMNSDLIVEGSIKGKKELVKKDCQLCRLVCQIRKEIVLCTISRLFQSNQRGMQKPVQRSLGVWSVFGPESPDEEEKYVIEEILNHRINRKGKLEYYLKWKGFTDADNTWEPAENLNCPGLVNVYETERKKKIMNSRTAKEQKEEKITQEDEKNRPMFRKRREFRKNI